MRECIAYIDALRGFAMYLVVIGHVLNHSGFKDSSLSFLIYSFHMPLFFAISGYVTGLTQKSIGEFNFYASVVSFLKYVWKKFRAIMMPYLIWMWIVLPYAIQPFNGFIDYFDSFQFIFIENRALWFFPVLFTLVSLYAFYLFIIPFCEKIRISTLKTSSPIVISIIVLVGLFLLTHNSIIRGAISYLIPFALGIAMGKSKSIFDFILNSEILYLIGFVVFCGAEGIFSQNSINIYGQIARLLCGMSSIVLLFPLFRNLSLDNLLGKWLIKIGNNTLIIYILHSCWLGSLWNFSIYNLPFYAQIFMALSIATAMILCCLVISSVINNNKYLRIFLLGKSK